MNDRQWKYAHVVAFLAGALSAHLSGRRATSIDAHIRGILAYFAKWQLDHPILIASVGLASMLWAVMSGKAKKRDGIVIYLFIGLFCGILIQTL